MTLALRPEHLSLCAPDDALVSGEITFVRQLGAMLETHVAVDEQTLIRSTLNRDTETGPMAIGARVGLAFDLGRAWVIPA